MKSLLILLPVAAIVVHGAINVDGTRVERPVSEDDASPIADTLTYIPDQHDCPLPCHIDYANVHKWTPYHSIDRLERCKLPMLLHFSVLNPLDDPDTDVLLRSCTLGEDPAAAGDRTVINATSIPIDNPKNGTNLVEVSLRTAPACAIDGDETDGELAIGTGGSRGSHPGLASVLDGMKTFFDTKDNCDETFLFGYLNHTVAGLHIGAGLGKPTVASALGAVAKHLEEGDSMAELFTAEICGGGRGPETVFGLAVNTNGSLAATQKTIIAWSRGGCAIGNGPLGGSGQATLRLKVFDIASTPISAERNGTANSTSRVVHPRAYGQRSNTLWSRSGSLGKRDTCKYIRVESGDGCASLAAKCGIRGADFVKYNPKSDLCSTLQPGDYVCCSAGDPYTEPKPEAPQPNADGSCAVHYIQTGDTCAKIGKTFGLTEEQIESFNKGKAWGWTECKSMLAGYNMCLSTGRPPLPPPQQGTECGPLVPGTQQSDTSIPMAELNPCPLKACCSNWGFCGPFPEHCDIHAPEGGGPGTKLPGFRSTCVSNCGNEIKQNSGPPANFSRIGYYESWNLNRKCLWLKAGNSNTDGSYTHIHWGFAEIDPSNWKVVIKDPHNQWEAFKGLPNVKRIISFGGWAYSTEAATYNIIRQAIIVNRETFATNIAQFLNDEKLDGVDIDWEYPGAPDITVDGQVIGQKGDGVSYLRFLTVLKSKVGASKSVSIAAPASYWYLKAFPIDRIAAVIDYIVYMTYDLHGQWDYGNPNAFDSCPSGKCIRSHVNLTETRNTLSIITKAGVANNKIFVGESSYGRSFYMAVDGCWGPMCEFTGTRLQSDANPGRCTDTRGYISNAEINEIIRGGSGQQLHDGDSNTDVLLYQGDYISYMTPTTKDTRRSDWKSLNFAGTIDWAVDLQSFGKDDFDVPIETPSEGSQGCVSGESDDLNADDLCAFACAYGFCPENTCRCLVTGRAVALPPVMSTADFVAWDEQDVDLQRLCKFACTYGFCPPDTCGTPVVDEWDDGSVDSNQPSGGLWDKEKNYNENRLHCFIFKDGSKRDISTEMCYANACKQVVDEATAEGRTTNYGCVGHFPLDQPIPWLPYPGNNKPGWEYAVGRCSCDNGLVNWFADTIIDALPIIAQIGCYIVMSAFKLVLDVGLSAIPGVGKILDAGLDAVTTAAQVVSYAYPSDQDPVGAFEWWLSPCGGSDLVPEDIKRVFGILSNVADGVSSFRQPKNLKKGSGKKGDAANPTDRSKPKAGTGSGPNGTGNNGVTKKRKCNVPAGKSSIIMGAAKNTLRLQSCVAAGGGASTTTKNDLVITSVEFGTQPTTISKVCSQQYSQACFHYSSAIAQNPSWAVLKCPHGGVKNLAVKRPGPQTWYDQHHPSWRNDNCDVDEYPPRYLLADTDPEIVNAGKPGGQLMRFLPNKENQGAGRMWKGACFSPHIEGLTPAQFMQKWRTIPAPKIRSTVQNGVLRETAPVSVGVTPYFRISSFEHASNPPVDAGMWDNRCWPKQKAANDPGFTLWHWDAWYNGQPGHTHLYDFTKAYDPQNNNGS